MHRKIGNATHRVTEHTDDRILGDVPIRQTLGKAGCAIAMAFAALTFAACTTTLPNQNATPAEQRAEINNAADAALQRLYQTVPGSRQHVERAQGVLVFPETVSGGFIVGVEHGRGVLRVGGQNSGYYTTSSGSFGLQAGAQSRSIIILFMTQEALNQFRSSSGWTAGVDATVAVATGAPMAGSTPAL